MSRTPDPVTPELVGQWATETLEEWLDKHYTSRLEDGRQRVVRHWSDDVYTVEDFEGYHPDRKFRVKVVVEEVQ